MTTSGLLNLYSIYILCESVSAIEMQESKRYHSLELEKKLNFTFCLHATHECDIYVRGTQWSASICLSETYLEVQLSAKWHCARGAGTAEDALSAASPEHFNCMTEEKQEGHQKRGL